MPLVLVWAGEHYVVDTLLGALLRGRSSCSAALVRRCTRAPIDRVTAPVPV